MKSSGGIQCIPNDNTLYDYTVSHKLSLLEVSKYLLQNHNITYEQFNITYTTISNSLKYELGNTASSHNRNIYFKHLCEELSLSYNLIEKLGNIYWNKFYTSMRPYDYVVEFIKWNKNKNIKIGILTDFETEYQIEKLKRLKLLELIDIVVTSEEIGIEKPSTYMFNTILNKLNLQKHEVIMIGDNYKKDILGATNCKIYALYYNNTGLEYDISKEYIQFNSYKVIFNKLTELFDELKKLEQLSKYCGERFDLVQAGGGNSSIKQDSFMFIKSSGINITNVNINSGFTVINNSKLTDDITSDCIKDNISEYNLFGVNRASIETYMHSILQKYTIHLHPIQVNKILISKNAKQIINELFPEALVIDYYTPGIKVCKEILKYYKNENIIFLLNHGLVISTNTIEELYICLNYVTEKCEDYLNLDLNKYKLVNCISRVLLEITNEIFVTYLSEDIIINEYLKNQSSLLKENITFPDALIYCGKSILFINTLDKINISKYIDKFSDIPKIIVYNNLIYITATTLAKCKDTEAVFKANLMILDNNMDNVYLDHNEITLLNNWDAEKYRKNI